MSSQFDLQDECVLKWDYLLDYNIKPRDILDLIIKPDLTKFIKDNGVRQRGDDILNILEHYKDVENLYLENYSNVAFRDLNLLKENKPVALVANAVGYENGSALARVFRKKMGISPKEWVDQTH